MKNQLTSQASLHSFTAKVELAAQLLMLVPVILNIVIRYRVHSVSSSILNRAPISRFPTFLPSIHLYNQKQTKLFAFVIV